MNAGLDDLIRIGMKLGIVLMRLHAVLDYIWAAVDALESAEMKCGDLQLD